MSSSASTLASAFIDEGYQEDPVFSDYIRSICEDTGYPPRARRSTLELVRGVSVITSRDELLEFVTEVNSRGARGVIAEVVAHGLSLPLVNVVGYVPSILNDITEPRDWSILQRVIEYHEAYEEDPLRALDTLCRASSGEGARAVEQIAGVVLSAVAVHNQGHIAASRGLDYDAIVRFNNRRQEEYLSELAVREEIELEALRRVYDDERERFPWLDYLDNDDPERDERDDHYDRRSRSNGTSSSEDNVVVIIDEE